MNKYQVYIPTCKLSCKKGQLSLLTNIYFKKGYYVELEGAQSMYSTNTNSGPPTPGAIKSFEPFIKANAKGVCNCKCA